MNQNQFLRATWFCLLERSILLHSLEKTSRSGTTLFQRLHNRRLRDDVLIKKPIYYLMNWRFNGDASVALKKKRYKRYFGKPRMFSSRGQIKSLITATALPSSLSVLSRARWWWWSSWIMYQELIVENERLIDKICCCSV